MDKLCECGCGQPAPIAETTNKTYGWIKGQPKRFIHPHNLRAVRGKLLPHVEYRVNVFRAHVVKLHKQGHSVKEIAVRLGYPRGQGQGRVRKALHHAGLSPQLQNIVEKNNPQNILPTPLRRILGWIKRQIA